MAGKPSKPSFLWQAVLILLPVVVLAVIGWASLRQDKILAEHDARERAQAIADQLLPTFWKELTVSPGDQSSNHVAFWVDEKGRLAFPPLYDPAPAPKPFSLTELSREQARLWTSAQTGTMETPAAEIEACKRFIDSNPPDRFAAAARYQLGLLFLQADNWAEALELLDSVKQYPDALGESGLPLLPLAQFKMIQLQPPSLDPAATRFRLNVSVAARNGTQPVSNVWVEAKHFVPLDSFCSNIVYHPTLLTPFLLKQAEEWVKPLPAGTSITLGATDDRKYSNLAAQTNQSATVQKWQRVWLEHEHSREMFAAAREHFRTNAFAPLLSTGANKNEGAVSGTPVFWFTLAERHPDGTVILDRNWIATRADGDTNGIRFNCRPDSDLGIWITTNTEHIPPYFGVGVEVAGKRIAAGAPLLTYWQNEYVSGGKGGGQYWEEKHSGKTSTNLLASATKSENGTEQIKVTVYLTSPDELFASQQSRAMWFGLLVITSTVVALVGLFASWHAFNRQLRLNEMKSNFVSSVSHELRAPIASVRLMAESLERGKVAEPQKQNEYFRFIVQECRRLSSLIENVLDFSRIEQGRKQYEFEPTDLLALTRETVKLMEPYAEEKGVILETSNLEPRTPNVELEVDGRAIQQALVNLIDNAIKHSAKGQIVTIGLDCDKRRTGILPVSNFQLPDRTLTNQRSDSETGKLPVLLYVEDSGPGIPPAEHEKIFERFYRLGSELRRETQGVGIGLSIVRHIVEAHGGHVTVRSNPGEGSRFTIELPTKRIETTDEHG